MVMQRERDLVRGVPAETDESIGECDARDTTGTGGDQFSDETEALFVGAIPEVDAEARAVQQPPACPIQIHRVPEPDR